MNSNMPHLGSPYLKLLATLLVSFMIMYAVMFLNVASIDHIYLSLNRTYMALLMVAPMPLLMLSFMRHMYPNRKKNLFLALASSAVFVAALAMLRNQTFISDEQYMKAMIPHHSSAIMTSTHANLMRADAQKLARDIIETQIREIELMKQYLQIKGESLPQAGEAQ